MKLVAQGQRDRDLVADALPRPWWAADSPRPLFPMGTLFLVGRIGSRWSGVLTIAVLSLLVLTRVLAFPESIWDQDEAYLCHAVVDFDPVDNQPHPPWFPAWVAAGRLAAPLFSEPADGLRVLSALSSVWMVFPLTALFGLWMRRDLALVSALLYMCLPGPWFLSGRAFTDTPATFLLVLAAAWWLRPCPSRIDLLCGSLAGGMCLLVRPQLVLPVLGLLVWRLITAGERQRLALTGPLIAVVAIGVVGLLVAGGGIAPLADAYRVHAEYQLEGLDRAELTLRDSGLARALIVPEAAVAWLVLATIGFGAWTKNRHVVGSPLPLLVGVIGPLVTTVVFFSNPEITRYALPFLALTCGPVVLATAVLSGRWAPVLVAVAITASLVIGVPRTITYRSDLSPPVAALIRADELADGVRGTMVVERTLVSFAGYLAASGDLRSRFVTDFSIEIGAVDAPDPPATVAVFPGRRAGFVRISEHREDFSCEIEWLKRLERDRFLEVTVEAGADVEAGTTLW